MVCPPLWPPRIELGMEDPEMAGLAHQWGSGKPRTPGPEPSPSPSPNSHIPLLGSFCSKWLLLHSLHSEISLLNFLEHLLFNVSLYMYVYFVLFPFSERCHPFVIWIWVKWKKKWDSMAKMNCRDLRWVKLMVKCDVCHKLSCPQGSQFAGSPWLPHYSWSKLEIHLALSRQCLHF